MPSLFWIKVKIVGLLFTPLGVVALAALLDRVQRYWAMRWGSCRRRWHDSRVVGRAIVNGPPRER